MPAQTTFKLRRGAASLWTSTNPVLNPGEPGLETDTNKVKYGDGVTAWNALDYASGGASVEVGVTAPVDPQPNTLWFNSETATMYIRLGSNWVETSPAVVGPQGPTGATGPQGLQGPSGVISVSSPITNTGTTTSAVLGLNQSALTIAQSQVTNLSTDLAAKASTSSPTISNATLTGNVSIPVNATLQPSVYTSSTVMLPGAVTVTKVTQTLSPWQAIFTLNDGFTYPPGTINTGNTISINGLLDPVLNNAPFVVSSVQYLPGNNIQVVATTTDTAVRTAWQSQTDGSQIGFATTVSILGTTPVSISTDELSYLNNVTSNIQTQLNSKAATSHTHNATDITTTSTDVSANYTIVAGDKNKYIRSTNSAITITIPDVLANGESVNFIQAGAGQITFAGSGVTINSADAKLKTAKQFAGATVVKLGGAYYLIGNLA